MKWVVIMVENYSDGDIENGLCEPSWFKDLIEANCENEAIKAAEAEWNDSCEPNRFSCSGAEVATKEEIAEYNEMRSMWENPPFV